MTLGRSSTGAIKIKTDSPGLRAVECACCVECNCSNRPTGKFKFISTSFSPIVYQDTVEQCVELYPGDPNPIIYHAFAALANGGAMTLVWRNCSGDNWMNWEVTLYNFSGSVSYQCSNMLAFTSSIDPTGTHQFYGCFSYEPGYCDECDDWTVTIGLNNE
jgi:hypothetical protein